MAEVDLKTFRNQPVNALYSRQHRIARDAQAIFQQHSIPYWEADIRPSERFLMERFITAAAQIDIPVNQSPVINPKFLPIVNTHWCPELKMVWLDIETRGDAKRVYSVGVGCDAGKKVCMEGESEYTETVIFCADARQCLLTFFEFFHMADPDI